MQIKILQNLFTGEYQPLSITLLALQIFSHCIALLVDIHIASIGLKLIIDRSLWISFPEIIHLVFKASSSKESLKSSLNENHILLKDCVRACLFQTAFH